MSLGGIGASLAAGGRGGRPGAWLLGAALEASGAAADEAFAMAMLFLSADATFLPAALVGDGCGEGERDGERAEGAAAAAGSLAGQSGRMGKGKRFQLAFPPRVRESEK